MFDIFAKLLSTVATFLFPVFASYKALSGSDPAQLKPWLMYWVVLACALLVESWTEFILVWVPFYPWIRAGFLLYLIAPQTQGARILYQEHVEPFLHEHEVAIDNLITSAHERAKAAGFSYLKQLIELVKQNVLGLPPQLPSPSPTPATMSYTQSLISRFNLPSTRPVFQGSNIGSATTSSGTDFYALLASAVTAVTSVSSSRSPFNNDGASVRDFNDPGKLIPPNIHENDRMNFIIAQRERLSILLSALDKEATNIRSQDSAQKAGPRSVPSMSFDGTKEDQPRSVSSRSGMSKSRSEADFEKIEKEDGGDDHTHHRPQLDSQGSGSWLPWGWGSSSPPIDIHGAKGVEPAMEGGGGDNQGKSSAIDA